MIRKVAFVFFLALFSPAFSFSTGKTVSFPNGRLILYGEVYRPEGIGRFPAVLYNHGSAPEMYSQDAFDALGPVFVQHGWVFFAPWRRGQGLSASAGPYIEDEINAVIKTSGIPAAADLMVRRLETDQLRDQLAGLKWLRGQKFVDAKRIAVMGNSFGGIETVFGAERGQYCAAVDASGGAESWKLAPGLQASMIRAVRNARAPIFFLQAENDYDLSPSITLSQAMKDAKKPFEMKIYPPFGDSADDGHSFAYLGSSVWADDVFRFLGEHCVANR